MVTPLVAKFKTSQYHLTFSEYAASVSQITKPATPFSNQKWSARCRKNIHFIFYELLTECMIRKQVLPVW